MSATTARATATLSVNSKEDQAIRSRFDEFVTAWNQHDPRTMSSLFAEDADLINPFGRAAKSRQEIEQMFRDEHSGPLKQSRMSLRFENVRFLAPDVAITNHAYELAGARDPSGKEITMHGHLTEVLKKNGGDWFFAAARPVVPLTLPDAR